MSDFPTPPQHCWVTTMNGPASVHPWGVLAAAAWSSANRAVYTPVIIRAQYTVKTIGVYIGTSSGNLDVGIYLPNGTRIVSSGSTAAGTGSAVQSINITDTTLSPGLYYAALACDNTTIQIGAKANQAGANLVRGQFTENSAFALPATATFAAPASDSCPFMILSPNSVI